MKGIQKDLSGKRFGKLIVLSFDHRDTRGNACWICQCDCGKNHIVRGTSLERKEISSCGCYRVEVGRKRILDSGKMASHSVFLRYKMDAKKRNKVFELSEEQFLNIVAHPCVYCGKPPSNICHLKNFGDFVYSGIDRINSEDGYVEGNVAPCCITCNRAKSNLSYSDFRDWIYRISDNFLSKEIRYETLRLEN